MNAATAQLTETPPPAGPIWICRAHRHAGLGSEPRCCAVAHAVRGTDRSLWYSERIARKPEDVRLDIIMARRDADACMNTIARCAHAHGKLWFRTRISSGAAETVRLR